MHDSERSDAQAQANLLAHLPQGGIEQRFVLLHGAVHWFPPAQAERVFKEQEFLLLIDNGHYDGGGVRVK